MSKRTSIYELTLSARDLVAEGMGGFDYDAGFDAWMDRVGEWVAQAGDKYVACRAVIARAGSEAEFLREEAARLQARAAILDNTQRRVGEIVETLLREHIELKGERKVGTSDGSWVKLAERRSEAVVVEDEAVLPGDFWRVKREPDKTAIKAALKGGSEVPGARIEERVSESVQWGK